MSSEKNVVAYAVKVEEMSEKLGNKILKKIGLKKNFDDVNS